MRVVLLLLTIFAIFAVCAGNGDFSLFGDGSGGVRDFAQEARNKELVLKYNVQVYGQRNLDGMERFFARSYIQHDPSIEDGVQGIVKYVRSLFPPGTPPNPRFTIEHVVSERELVWVHALTNFAAVPDPVYEVATATIYRLANDLIIESFSVSQAVPRWSMNPHPLAGKIELEYQPQCAFVRKPSQ